MSQGKLAMAFTLGLVVCLPGKSRADDTPLRPGELASQVQAIFSAKCAACHGSDVPKPRGGFDYVLDLRRVAGNPNMVASSSPEGSELWTLIRNGEMPPPDAPPLTAAQKKVIRSWIAAGAPVEDTFSVPSAAEKVSSDEAMSEPVSRSPVKRTLLWLGKFHLLMLHFPIGLLVAAGVAELWAVWTGTRVPLAVVRFCVELGAVAAVPTVAFGWLWALTGHGAGSAGLLDLHRWLGTAAGGCAVVMALGSEWDARRGVRTWSVRVLLLVGTLLVTMAAHLGGLLAHGQEFFRW